MVTAKRAREVAVLAQGDVHAENINKKEPAAPSPFKPPQKASIAVP